MEDINTVTDDLSDSELRRRLAQYGFPILPVTDTTRKVLLKKLKNAVTSENTKTRRETVAVSKFSSDEDPEVKAKASKTSNRRATVAITQKSSVKKLNDTAIDETVETPSKKNSRKKISSQVLQEDSTDDDITEIENRRSSSRAKTPTLGKSDVVRTSYKTSVDVVEEIAEEPPVVIKPVSRRKTFTTSTTNFTSNQENPISKSNTHRQTYGFKQPVETDTLDDLDTPYLSNFAKRLSTLRAEPLDDGMDKYKRLRESGASLGYKSNSNINIQAQPQLKAHPRNDGMMKSLGQLADTLDKQHNFRNVLYISFIVMIVVAIYVIFFM